MVPQINSNPSLIEDHIISKVEIGKPSSPLLDLPENVAPNLPRIKDGHVLPQTSAMGSLTDSLTRTKRGASTSIASPLSKGCASSNKGVRHSPEHSLAAKPLLQHTNNSTDTLAAAMENSLTLPGSKQSTHPLSFPSPQVDRVSPPRILSHRQLWRIRQPRSVRMMYLPPPLTRERPETKYAHKTDRLFASGSKINRIPSPSEKRLRTTTLVTEFIGGPHPFLRGLFLNHLQLSLEDQISFRWCAR